MKLFIIILLILMISCESIIDANDVKTNEVTPVKDFNYIVSLIDGLNASTGDALNELIYISAISTDEAIETSTETAHNQLASQKFDSYNSNVIRVFNKFQKLAEDAKNVQTEISEIMAPLFQLAANDSTSIPEDTETIAFNESVKSITLTKWQDVDTLYRGYAQFFEGYAVYKLASNWDSDTQLNYSQGTDSLFVHARTILDSAYYTLEDLPFTKEPSELKTLQAMVNYYRAYCNLNLYKRATTASSKTFYLTAAARNTSWENVGALVADDYKVRVSDALINKYSNTISTRLIFSSTFFEDDARLAIYEPEEYRLQGSVTEDDSLYIAFDYSKNGYLQNKFTSSNSEISIYHEKDNTSILHAEILYYLLLEGKKNLIEDIDDNGNFVSAFNVQEKINNGRAFNTKRTDLTYELDDNPFNPTLDKDTVLIPQLLNYIQKEYLAVDFLEGTRFETLRRLGIKPYKTGASSEYVFPSSY